MSPLKSSLARSVGKFLGVYRNDDLVLNSSVISNRFISQQTDFITGSGGVVTAGISSDGYKYHTFTSPGTFTWTGGNDNSAIEFLIVGGGGLVDGVDVLVVVVLDKYYNQLIMLFHLVNQALYQLL